MKRGRSSSRPMKRRRRRRQSLFSCKNNIALLLLPFAIVLLHGDCLHRTDYRTRNRSHVYVYGFIVSKSGNSLVNSRRPKMITREEQKKPPSLDYYQQRLLLSLSHRRQPENQNCLFYREGEQGDQEDVYPSSLSSTSQQQHQKQPPPSSSSSATSALSPYPSSSSEKLDLNIIIIDHYDSYTYNIYDMFAQICKTPPTVYSKDSFATWNDLVATHGSNKIDGIVLSPGPGKPSLNETSLAIDCIKTNGHNTTTATTNSTPTIPILGVCLGHQILGHVYGYNVTLCPSGPKHGLISQVYEEEQDDKRNISPIWKDVIAPTNKERDNGKKASSIDVVRYHSLVVDMMSHGNNANDDTVDCPLQSNAYCYDNEDGNSNNSHMINMALQHKTLPYYGVQFHPESIGTEKGMKLIENFCRICQEEKSKKNNEQQSQINEKYETTTTKTSLPTTPSSSSSSLNKGKHDEEQKRNNDSYQVIIHKISPESSAQSSISLPDPDIIYDRLFSKKQYSFWLDSSNNNANDRAQEQSSNAKFDYTKQELNRFSIMGGYDDTNESFKRIEYYGKEYNDESQQQAGQEQPSGLYVYDHNGSHNAKEMFYPNDDILSYLKKQIDVSTIQLTAEQTTIYNSSSSLSSSFSSRKDNGEEFLQSWLLKSSSLQEQLPFDYRGGYVGYLGYEVRHDTQRYLEKMEHGGGSADDYDGYHNAATKTCNSNSSRKTNNKNGDSNNVPTAAFLFADRSLLYDHYTNDWYVIGIVTVTAKSATNNSTSTDPTIISNNNEEEIVNWMKNMTNQIQSMTKNAMISINDENHADHNGREDNANNTSNKSPTAHQITAITKNNNHLITSKPTFTTTTPSTTTAASEVKMPSSTTSNDLEYRTKPSFILNPSRSFAQYQEDIKTCHEHIRQGDSYELCLTDKLEAIVSTDSSSGDNNGNNDSNKNPYGLYKILRKRNPAPFAAFLNFNTDTDSGSKCLEQGDYGANAKQKQSASVAICCSSPERFMSIKKHIFSEDDEEDRQHNVIGDDIERLLYRVESKPIKGTIARQLHSAEQDKLVATELQNDIKNRAENLMIVDLLRNDLSRICIPGTVHVPVLMGIESYATVHQMVSTIRGTLAISTKATKPNDESMNEVDDGIVADNISSTSPVDVLLSTFPGGSMTGAPKKRTMELLHDIEQGVCRGPYSGSLGYISLNGCMDMNIIIRTAVVTPVRNDSRDNNQEYRTNNCGWKVSIGAGGAITALSEPDSEYKEMLLKAKAIKESIEYWCNTTTTSASSSNTEFKASNRSMSES